METLEINSNGDYKITMNKDIINKEVENMLNSIITSEHVLYRLKDVKLEGYTRDDLLERYIVYGTEQELQNPTIQRALINNDFHIDLLDMVDIITDKLIERAILIYQKRKEYLAFHREYIFKY